MIKNSFIILDGIGKQKEKSLWDNGVADWDSFLEAKRIRSISEPRKCYFDRQLIKAKHELRDGNSKFFTNVLPSAETWRLYRHFKEDCLFLDIETSNYYGNITVIGMSDGNETKQMVRGFNLDKSVLKKELEKYKILVTFNGKSFDVPVINKFFNKVVPEIPHIDLRHVCRKIGLTGGLKLIEKQIGIKRDFAVQNLGSEDAIYLWDRWQKTGDRKWLEMLTKYNEEDTVNLKQLMEHCYSRLERVSKI